MTQHPARPIGTTAVLASKPDTAPWLLHNVADVLSMQDGGLRFQRFPESVRLHLNEHAADRAFDVVGTEVRFVLEGATAEVQLHALANTTSLQVFWGDFRVNEEQIVGPDLRTITIRRPDWLLGIPRRQLGRTAFDTRVCRVFLARGTICFHGVTGDIRRPLPSELPARSCLGYGTSITQGAGSSMRHLAYLFQTAMRLRMDAIDLGCAASCLCEPVVADHIAARRDWDLALLEISTNMSGFPLPEFRDRVDHMVRVIAQADPSRWVVPMTLFPKAADLGPEHIAKDSGGTPEQYREVLRAVVVNAALPNVRLIEGRDLLREWRGLGPDLLHPSDFGHTLIAERLARRLRPLLRVAPGASR